MPALELVDRADQRAALSVSAIAFAVCFAVWTLFSIIIGVRLRRDVGLNETRFGPLAGAPILAG